MSHTTLSPPRLPGWLKWVLSFVVGAAVLAALIVFVDNNNDYGAEAHQNPAAVARANQESAVIVRADQAPHVFNILGPQAPQAAAVRGVRSAMRQLIAQGFISGPLGRVTCAQAGGSASRRGFHCTGVAAEVNYPFLVVVSDRGRRLTLCKRDIPPALSMNVPVSSRCVA